MTTPDAPAFRNLSTEALTEPFDLVLDLRVALRRLGRKFPMDEQSTTAQTAAAAALLAALGVDTADQAGHVTTIEGPDAAGHWEWRCTRPGCHTDAGGYDQAADVIAAATAHGLLAADSLIPTDDDAAARDARMVAAGRRQAADAIRATGDPNVPDGRMVLLEREQAARIAERAPDVVGSDRSQTREGPAAPERPADPGADPACRARRPERGDRECGGPVEFAVTYRSKRRGHHGELVDYTPGCGRHCAAESIRAALAGTMAAVNVERLANVERDWRERLGVGKG